MKRTAVSLIVIALLIVTSCATGRKVEEIRRQALSARIALPSEKESRIPELEYRVPAKDTLRITDLDGREVIIMKAIRDEESGDMVATEELDAAVVTARFRNVAERRGRIDLEFQVIVPSALQDSRWQLRFHPDMYILGDSVRLDDILITGYGYRKAQLKGYQHYERFLRRLTTDSTLTVDRRNLEIFLERNIPELYAFRCDSAEVSDEDFESCFGLNGKDVLDHYTNTFRIRRTERMRARREKIWRRYVKAPFFTEGIRLDTVIRSADGDIVYNYIQTIGTRAKLRKVDISLGGEIYEQDRRIYTVPQSEPLTFYISSVSSFVDGTERYLTRVISRRATANTTCTIDFRAGRHDIDESIGSNRREIAFVKDNLRALLEGETFELDSITVTASASPEGSVQANKELSLRRSRAASDYFSAFMDYLRDSLRREDGVLISLDDDLRETGVTYMSDRRGDIRFLSRGGGENWALLDELVGKDSTLTQEDRDHYRALSEIRDPDVREKSLRDARYYRHLRDDLYPRLRTVRFDFALHRRGMVKDTVHTTVIDSSYMRAVDLLRDHEYEKALDILYDYQDYNTAVAYIALDRNASAMQILQRCEPTAPVNYMMALVHSRQGDDEKAVECYTRSCQQDPSYVFRGNLDPEISSLIRKYGLNAEPEDDFDDLSY